MKANIHIRTAVSNGVTRLRQTYFTPPFKVADIREDKRSPLLHLMLMCSSPGILDGDEHSIRIDLERASSLQLHTQSYQRLFDMRRGARQSMAVTLAPGASFYYLPHPCVPHRCSDFLAKNKICLSEDCRLVWAEVLTCGRQLHGEEFVFSKYHSVTELYLHDQLILRDNICLRPSLSGVRGIGQWEGFTHQAGMLIFGYGAAEGTSGQAINEYLAAQAEILYGISEGPSDVLVIRMLGNKAEPLHGHLKKIAELLFHTKPVACAS